MRTRQLMLIGTILALSSLSLMFLISEVSPKPEIQKTPNLELIGKLVDLGCTESAINHVFRYSSLLHDSFDGTYYVDAIGYPDGLSQDEFDKCVKIILEKRLPSEDTLPLASEFDGDVSVFNRCTPNQICLGSFENETRVLLECDLITHGCPPISFDDYQVELNPEPEPQFDRKFFCESYEGKWSDVFNNCVGGSIETSCDDIDASELTSTNVFGKNITEEGLCISHEKFCSSMGGTTACMSYEQIGHGRDICIAVCEFED